MTQKNPPARQLALQSEADTRRLAEALADELVAGDVVLLNGGLAAGKTFFVRAAVAALGSDDNVNSPTYTLANIYQTKNTPVLHMDVYRLNGPADFADLALEDELEQSITFIEWGGSLKNEFESYIQLDLATDIKDDATRIASLSASGAPAEAALNAAMAVFQEGST